MNIKPFSQWGLRRLTQSEIIALGLWEQVGDHGRQISSQKRAYLQNEPTVPRRRAPKTGSEIGSFLLQGVSVNHWAIMLPKNVLYENI